MTSNHPPHSAPFPARGFYADGFDAVARCFAAQFERGEQVGASFSVYHRGALVVDLWGGMADVAKRRVWKRDTRIVVFSVTKGFAAMAMQLLADRGQFDWDEPVTERWPGFGRCGKQAITIRTLVFRNGSYTYQAGAGIVADSVPEREHEEVLAKSAALEAALTLAEEGL